MGALTLACSGGGDDDLEAFRDMARAEPCADRRNELFLVDETMVFWTHLTNGCADTGGFDLFGATPDDQLCISHSTIGGGVHHCNPGVDQALFDTMVTHYEEPDLGLGPGHVVEPIPF